MIESLLHNSKTPRKELIIRSTKLNEQQSFDFY